MPGRKEKTMLKHIDRYSDGQSSIFDVYVLTYESGKTRSVTGFENLPKTAKRFIAAAENFQFMREKSGQYFHRFSA